MPVWPRDRARLFVWGLLLGGWCLLWAAVPAAAEEKKTQSTATKPAPRDAKWMERHERFVEQAKGGDIDVLFLGDSITDAWRSAGKEVWKKHFEPLKAANFGIGGDRTQHVLWRLQHGELEGIHPKLAVLMIGTNNMRDNTAAEIADGVKVIVHEIRHTQPHTKILVLGIFPRDPKPGTANRKKIGEGNQIISKLDDGGKHVRYLDIGDKFLDNEGNLPKDIMPDGLHPNAKGYEIWARAIQPTVQEMLKE